MLPERNDEQIDLEGNLDEKYEESVEILKYYNGVLKDFEVISKILNLELF